MAAGPPGRAEGPGGLGNQGRSPSARAAPGGGPKGLGRRSAPSGDALTEAALSHLWEGQRFPPEALVTTEGQRVRVLYRGRRPGGPGPDFRDAVIAVGEEARRGDVELHVRSSDFHRHGHHRDGAYNGLVLHVVFWDDASASEMGRAAPVVALAPWVGRRAQELEGWLAGPAPFQEPCHTAVARLGGEAVGRLLEEGGWRRFEGRVEGFRRMGLAEAEREGPQARAGWVEEEGVYRALLEALGYGGSRDLFQALAEGLPWRRARGLLQEGWRLATPSSPASRHARIEKDGWRAFYAEAWALLEPPRNLRFRGEPLLGEGATAGAPPETCGFVGSLAGPQRPANHPARRLAGGAILLARLLGWEGIEAPGGLSSRRVSGAAGPETGDGGRATEALGPLPAGKGQPLSPNGTSSDRTLALGLRGLVAGARGPGALVAALTVRGPDPLGRSSRPVSLIGASRALELAANVALPYVAARGDEARARELYRGLPAPPVYGVLRPLARALAGAGGRPPTRGALGCQGLLEQFHRYCRRGACASCPLS